MDVIAYGATAPGAPLAPMTIHRRELRPHDVRVEISFAGVCHSDIHQARNEWFEGIFPMVPGHEITGFVAEVGDEVTRFTVGDRVGIGVFIESCGECDACLADLGNYCKRGFTPTYNGRDRSGVPAYGGYSTGIVVDEHYVLRLPESLPMDAAAPLLCAGITTYSPLRTWGAGPGMRVGILGLGGLGHMGLKFAHAMGAEVTLISHSPSKEADARRLGADHFLLSSDDAAMKAAAMSLDLIVNAVSADIDVDRMMQLLDRDGTMALVGLPIEPICVSAFTLNAQRRRLAGSNIGGMGETQEMLDFCAEHGIASDIEVIDAPYINTAWDRVVASDVRYRFVIDVATI